MGTAKLLGPAHRVIRAVRLPMLAGMLPLNWLEYRFLLTGTLQARRAAAAAVWAWAEARGTGVWEPQNC